MIDNNHLKCTKIVCTIGPASNTKAMITTLLDAGMNILRLNFSHGTYEEHEKLFDIIDEIRKEGKYIFGVALDTKGPEIRAIMNDNVDVKKGDQLKFTSEKSSEHIQIENVDFNDVKKDYEFTLDDGLLRVKVVDANKLIVTEALNSHILKPNKSVNLPGIKLKIPFLSKKNNDDILFGVKHKVDYIFASFVSSPEDIQDIKNLIGNDQHLPMIIAKIESLDAVKYVEEIIKAADGIMVARGDLGAELPFEELHAAQKKITGKCKKHGKPVIIATQMLENMINCPVPKRCEITDIGNAVQDFADCIMLSAESATGERPVECVKMMSNIARVTETIQASKRSKKAKCSSIASAIKVLSTDKQVKAVVIISDCMADIIRIYKKQKHVKPIIAVMTNSLDMQRLTMYRNIVPFKFVQDQNKESNERLEHLMKCIKKKYELSSSDSVVIYRKDQKKHGIITVAKLA